MTAPFCPRCGRPQASGILCPGCAGWPAQIDGIRSPFLFGGVLREAIHQLKYNNLLALAAPLAGLLSGYLAESPIPADCLVPVPLHPKRLRERGCNQSELLARELGKLCGLTVAAGVLRRDRATPPQVRTLNLEQRRGNVAGAFSCGGQGIPGKRVLLIDDVATSGATLDACAAALKSAGASSVWGLVLATEA